MPIKNYQLLVGQPIDWTLDDDSNPHIEILLDVNGEKFRAAVNVRSSVAPHTLVYRRIQPFIHPITNKLDVLEAGIFDLRTDRSDLALDYPRDHIVREDEMAELPYRVDGPRNDLLDHLLPMVQDAVNTTGVRLYVFGETWGPETHERDKYFHFLPGRGIHDIHMNQGSQGRFKSTNGTHQDGALFIRHQDGSWTGIFLAFASQSWQTDGEGHPTTEITPPTEPITTTLPIRIAAALVNPYNPEEGRETVTLINISDEIIQLDGWRLEDGEGRTDSLIGYDLGAGDTVRVRLSGTGMRLKNKDHGRIKLISPDNVLVHEVTYLKRDVRNEGWTILF
jgi:uncharacterized protein YukJ